MAQEGVVWILALKERTREALSERNFANPAVLRRNQRSDGEDFGKSGIDLALKA